MASFFRYPKLRVIAWYLMGAAVILALCPWLWKDIPDAYFPYSGIVVDKGTDSLLGVGGWARYIVIQDAEGKRSKKYVDAYGYAFARTGMFVEKKRGFGKYPLAPGEKLPSEMLKEIEQRKIQKGQKNH
ncbi:MAG TPA: hypothetical protein VFR24_25190 [Candidatus Angelobacter sp.]|nr:hypothetical protein [Candidatus Angelobacter sp.]